MRTATQRRELSLSKRLAILAASDPQEFKKEWRQLLDAWSAEAFRRGNRLRYEDTAESAQPPVYGILEKAERLLALCGAHAERLVGAVTRDFLNNDCGHAFSKGVAPHLRCLSNVDSNYQLMKLGTHRPRR